MGEYPRTTLLLSLNRLQLGHDQIRGERGEMGLRVQLVLPRPNVASRDTVRLVRAKRGVTRFNGRDLAARLLFKQTVEGPFGLRVEVSRAQAGSEMASLIQKTFAGGLEQMVRFAAGSQLPPFRNLVREGGKFLGDLVEEENAPDVLGVGTLDLDSRPTKSRLEIALAVPETIRSFSAASGRRPSGSRKRTVKDIYRKGEPLGVLTLDFEVFD